VKNANGDYSMTGNLTLKGVTKSVVLNVEYGGSENNGHGVIKHGFEVTGTVNRRDFGMTWTTALICETVNQGFSLVIAPPH